MYHVNRRQRKEVIDIDINASEAGRRLGVSRQRAAIIAAEGRFPGAHNTLGVWHIPEESVEAMRTEREANRETHQDAGAD